MSKSQIIDENQNSEHCDNQYGRIRAQLRGAFREKSNQRAEIENNPRQHQHATGDQQNLIRKLKLLQYGVTNVAGNQQRQSQRSSQSRSFPSLPFHRAVPSFLPKRIKPAA